MWPNTSAAVDIFDFSSMSERGAGGPDNDMPLVPDRDLWEFTLG